MKHTRPLLPILCCFLVLMSTAQNVGIGISNPLFRLDVLSTANSPARFDASSPMYIALYENGTYRGYLGSFAGNVEDVDFGTGAGNTTGKLHFTTQASPRLTIDASGNVGIGTTTPAWKLDVQGNMQLLGRLYVSGSSGLPGQVLTSTGMSAPNWTTLAEPFSDIDRVMVPTLLTSVTAGVSADLRLGTAYYNLNPANFSVGTTGITVNTAGLYQLEFSAIANGLLVPVSGVLPIAYFSFEVGARSFLQVADRLDPATLGYSKTFHSSMLVHIPAGSVVSVSTSVSEFTSGLPGCGQGYFSIHRIK